MGATAFLTGVLYIAQLSDSSEYVQTAVSLKIAVIIQYEPVYQRKLSAMYRMSVDTYESRESKYLPWARICKNFKSCMQERKALGANDHETDGKRSVGRM